MPDAPECHVGHQPIAGHVFIVTIDDRKVPMCPVHGRTFQFGNALIALLGRDDPLVVDLVKALVPLMDSACPGVEGLYPSKGTCAQGTQNPLRGGSGSRGAGVLTGTAVS